MTITATPGDTIVEGQYFKGVATLFTGAPAFQHDGCIAIEDERADGAVHVTGFLKDGGGTWSGTIFRIGAPSPGGDARPKGDDAPPEEMPKDPPDWIRDVPTHVTQQAPAPEEGPKPEEGEGQGPGKAPGGDDELLALIHGIAGGRDKEMLEVVVPEIAGSLRDMIAERMDAIANETNLRLDDIATAGLTVHTVIEAKPAPPVKLPNGEMAHQDLAQVLALVKSGAKNVMLVGPAGCGKTTLARQVSQALGHETFAALSCSPGMSEAKVLGRIGQPTEANPTGQLTTRIMVAFGKGGTVLFDEMDNSDASMMVSFNAMTDGGWATLPNGDIVPRHPDTVIIAACNTYGHGADRMYVGRNQLDAATLDRFVGATVEMDYDRKLEKMLVPEKEVREPVWKLRQAVRKHNLRRVVSTRALIAARRRHLGMGEPMEQVLEHLTLGWSPQDRAAVKVGGGE